MSLICARACPGTPHRAHNLKHTDVALLALAGVDPSENARRAGHSNMAFTYDRHGHLFPEIDTRSATMLETIPSGGLDALESSVL